MSDRDRDGERDRTATRLIGASFGVSTLASLGLVVVYVLGGQPQIEGVLIAISLGGIAFGLLWWAHRLMPAGDFVQEKTPHRSPEAEAALERDLDESGHELARRSFIVRMLTTAAGVLGIAALVPIRSLGSKPGGALLRTDWAPGARLVTGDGSIVTTSSLEVGGVLTVFPEGHVDSADSQTILVRVEPAEAEAVAGAAASTPEGYLAFSKICTHAGCPVGLYQAETHELFCPCHQSVFDVLKGAAPVGGPATRPLPQLPLEAGSDGTLTAQSDFTTPVGPGFWNED